MSNHSKRSKEFQEEIENVITRLKRFVPTAGPVIHEIEVMLRVYTTDSPCVVKAKDDEPIFTLKASDETASGLVINWINQNPQVSLEKQRDALDCANQMIDYHTHKQAD